MENVTDCNRLFRRVTHVSLFLLSVLYFFKPHLAHAQPEVFISPQVSKQAGQVFEQTVHQIWQSQPRQFIGADDRLILRLLSDEVKDIQQITHYPSPGMHSISRYHALIRAEFWQHSHLLWQRSLYLQSLPVKAGQFYFDPETSMMNTYFQQPQGLLGNTAPLIEQKLLFLDGIKTIYSHMETTMHKNKVYVK